MALIIATFLIAFGLSLLGTLPLRQFAIKIGFVDAPESRKMHKEPMPLMGGVAIFGGAIVAFLLIFVTFEFYSLTRPVIGILLGMGIISAVGLIDDRMGGMSAPVKLAGQCLAVTVLIWFGVMVSLPVPSWLNVIFTFVWVIVISNATNFLDNMDGACAGIAGVQAAFITLLGAINEQFLVAGLAAAVFGSCLGFLRHNFKPAKIFMGDAGSLFLGFLLAVLTLEVNFPKNSNFVTWMVPLFVLGVTLFDLGLISVSRLRRGVNPFTTAGKDHTSHRLVELGFSQREAVLILYLFSGMLGMVAVFITQASILEGYMIGGLIAVLCISGIISLERWRAKQ
ncbi:MAG: UDP-GlcNAc:undecaprenyl-phosphate GlcNAc-1-phosphate transferase [Cellvibrionaceae bacterium]|jgi:UDP-GlcNAc:undecaprenyl-phosphate GlcNAc-1-phosphate transferase